MNKTKRTLIVSSIVLVLVFCVTVVSVTAAWFSNTASSSKDGFTIESTTVTESAKITIDEEIGDSNSTIWPAIVSPGVLAKGAISPTGAQLKQADGDVIIKGAKCAVFYFPISFIGSSDMQEGVSIDGRKTLALSVQSAKVVSSGNLTEEQLKAESANAKDIKDNFNVEMRLVQVGEDKSVSEISLDGVYSNSLSGTNNIYFEQKYDENGNPEQTLYMIVMPGVEYYVEAVVYFNNVDEYYDADLLYMSGKTVSITFYLQKDDIAQDVRAFKPSPTQIS